VVKPYDFAKLVVVIESVLAGERPLADSIKQQDELTDGDAVDATCGPDGNGNR
jgi:hypothetical protein